jgi:hypothetical protein
LGKEVIKTKIKIAALYLALVGGKRCADMSLILPA